MIRFTNHEPELCDSKCIFEYWKPFHSSQWTRLSPMPNPTCADVAALMAKLLEKGSNPPNDVEYSAQSSVATCQSVFPYFLRNVSMVNAISAKLPSSPLPMPTIVPCVRSTRPS